MKNSKGKRASYWRRYWIALGLFFLGGCAHPQQPQQEPPPPPPEMNMESESVRSAYLRDIRPRVVTYDGQSSESLPTSRILADEDFSAGRFLPVPSGY